MRERGKRLQQLLCIAVISILLALNVVYLFLHSLAPPKLVVYGESYEEDVKGLFGEVLKGVTKIRGLAPRKPVEVKVVTRDWVFKTWGVESVKEKREKLKVKETLYKALLLISQSENLSKAILGFSGMIIAATVSDTVYVVKEYFNPREKNARRILAHELVHVLQGQYFKPPPLKTHDQKQAWNALIEGDADFTADLYVKELDCACHFSEVPEPVLDILLFPYKYGENFVKTLYERGGWKAVNEAYRKPPTSTEQVIHIEKYINGEQPIPVSSFRPGVKELKLVKSDRLGEYFVYVLVKTWLGKNKAGKVAEGWGGDNVTVYMNKTDYLVLWLTAWDSEEDAKEFYEAFLEILREAKAETCGGEIWRVNGGFITVLRSGKIRVTVFSSSKKTIIKVVLKNYGVDA